MRSLSESGEVGFDVSSSAAVAQVSEEQQALIQAGASGRSVACMKRLLAELVETCRDAGFVVDGACALVGSLEGLVCPVAIAPFTSDLPQG